MTMCQPIRLICCLAVFISWIIYKAGTDFYEILWRGWTWPKEKVGLKSRFWWRSKFWWFVQYTEIATALYFSYSPDCNIILLHLWSFLTFFLIGYGRDQDNCQVFFVTSLGLTAPILWSVSKRGDRLVLRTVANLRKVTSFCYGLLTVSVGQRVADDSWTTAISAVSELMKH